MHKNISYWLQEDEKFINGPKITAKKAISKKLYFQFSVNKI